MAKSTVFFIKVTIQNANADAILPSLCFRTTLYQTARFRLGGLLTWHRKPEKSRREYFTNGTPIKIHHFQTIIFL